MCNFFVKVVQSVIAITKARTNQNDNSGAVDDGVSVGEGVKATVGVVVVVSVGEGIAEVDEGTEVGDEFGEAKFVNALNESFGFPLLSKKPKLESGLTV